MIRKKLKYNAVNIFRSKNCFRTKIVSEVYLFIEKLKINTKNIKFEVFII